MKILHILAALAPGLFTAVLGFVVTAGPMMARKVRAFLSVPELVERLREVFHDLSMVGSAAGVYIGFRDSDISLVLFTLMWFYVFGWLSNRAALRAAELREREAVKAHRKMAGTVRSIARDVVRAELDRRDKDI